MTVSRIELAALGGGGNHRRVDSICVASAAGRGVPAVNSAGVVMDAGGAASADCRLVDAAGVAYGKQFWGSRNLTAIGQQRSMARDRQCVFFATIVGHC